MIRHLFFPLQHSFFRINVSREGSRRPSRFCGEPSWTQHDETVSGETVTYALPRGQYDEVSSSHTTLFLISVSKHRRSS